MLRSSYAVYFPFVDLSKNKPFFCAPLFNTNYQLESIKENTEFC